MIKAKNFFTFLENVTYSKKYFCHLRYSADCYLPTVSKCCGRGTNRSKFGCWNE